MMGAFIRNLEWLMLGDKSTFQLEVPGKPPNLRGSCPTNIETQNPQLAAVDLR